MREASYLITISPVISVIEGLSHRDHHAAAVVGFAAISEAWIVPCALNDCQCLSKRWKIE